MENKEKIPSLLVEINNHQIIVFWLICLPILLIFFTGCEKNSTDAINEDKSINNLNDFGSFSPPDDPLFIERWYLLNLHQTIGGNVQGSSHADSRALEAWDISRGEDVIVAVLDAGIAATHPNFEKRLVSGWDFVDDDSDPEDVRAKNITSDVANLFHGTAVADAVLSIAPDAKIMPLRVIGPGSIKDQNVAAAIRFARDNGADIINMSLASLIPGFGNPQTAAAIAESPEVLVVASAGNDGSDANFTRPEPCTLELPNVLCVAATDENDQLATFFHSAGSNFGSETVHMAAPGTNFLIAQPTIKSIYHDEFSEMNSWQATKTESWIISSENGFDGSAGLEYKRQNNITAPFEVSIRMTTPVSFENEEGCYLDFWYWSDLDGSFLLNLESSSDGKLFILRPGAQGFSFVGHTNGEWRQAYVPLNFEMKNGEAYFGFYMRDGGGSQGHIRIDNLNVTCNDDQYDSLVDGYGYAEGTSFASPLTAGVAALVKSKYPNLTSVELKWSLMLGGQPLKSLFNKTISGTRLDARGALTIAQIFQNQPEWLAKSLYQQTVKSDIYKGFDVLAHNTIDEKFGYPQGGLLEHLKVPNSLTQLPETIKGRPVPAEQPVYQAYSLWLAYKGSQVYSENLSKEELFDLIHTGELKTEYMEIMQQVRTKIEETREEFPNLQNEIINVKIDCQDNMCEVEITHTPDYIKIGNGYDFYTEISTGSVGGGGAGGLKINSEQNLSLPFNGWFSIYSVLTGTQGKTEPGSCSGTCWNNFYR